MAPSISLHTFVIRPKIQKLFYLLDKIDYYLHLNHITFEMKKVINTFVFYNSMVAMSTILTNLLNFRMNMTFDKS